MAAERRRGRRDNGLEAADWRALGDLDPRIAEHMLDVLGTRGIAAYLQPAMDINPITRSTTVPDRPSDRLWVDRAHLRTAYDCLRRLLDEDGGESQGEGASGGHDEPPATEPAEPGGAGEPDPPASRASDGGTMTGNLDATFAGIVADFDRPVDPTAVVWPAAENVTGQTTAPAAPPEPPPPAGPVDARHVIEPSLLDALDTFGADLPDPPQETQGRFVPPPPPPLPRLSRQTVLGALAIVVGLMILLGGLSPFDRSTSMLLGFAATLGGAVALILRLRPGSDPDDDHHPDDGARV